MTPLETIHAAIKEIRDDKGTKIYGAYLPSKNSLKYIDALTQALDICAVLADEYAHAWYGCGDDAKQALVKVAEILEKK